MKVQVNIDFTDGLKSGVQPPKTSLKLAVKSFDSVQSLKQRLITLEPIPFPDQELRLDGKRLADDQRLGDAGVSDGQTLHLVVRASEDVFVKQLAELLEDKPLSATELGLLYCHQHGASAKQALTAIGSDEQLLDFLKRHKRFSLQDGGLVSLCKQATSDTIDKRLSSIVEGQEDDTVSNYCISLNIRVKTQSGNAEQSQVQLNVTSAQTVQSVCERALAAECIPFTHQDVVFQGQRLEAAEQLRKCNVTEGATLHLEMRISQESLVHQLADLLKDRSLSTVELGDHYCYRFGTPVSRALKLLGLRGQLKDFLKAHTAFTIESGLVVVQQAFSAKETAANEGYLKVNEDITGCSSIQQAKSALDLTIKAACEGSFLSVARVVRGGSVGRGTAIEGNADAKAMLLLNGMPPVGREKWMLPLLHALASALWQTLAGKAKDIAVKGDAVHVKFEGSSIELSLDAVAGPAALAAERTARFFEKQPLPAKITMKLLKWWRNQQSWKDVQFRPSDLILEVLAAQVAETLPADQDQAMQKAMELMANFKTCRLADPADPSVNLADDEAFDSRQMMELAIKSR
mmetsp:Transcript_92937/g.165267  ORF Transcript_92937/g.165267 Transcript_92937/m.165267 type:complete len:575 (-) Transcript_92937:170-1894(-)|eukprot:CAMPEP_0197656844 /NCGR_PEP_ID=MMETSP1338-20131121/43630_1 /TAXON_ID=43686 ORGANISM="Pelagodinium beii, Strain RCC1491" /NCGR_SAMPLE_ID=MMETSP1338 /ASSEMBLY_ACC=CAM_ASM_000754 /LENGTH=574 /DNA_ID=CAMNT_0043233047 /DNA_START=178 /DNA_END=1902 /DNA_ORIENTATION=-